MRIFKYIPQLVVLIFAAQAHAEWVCNWDPPAYLDKVQLLRSPELAKLRQCEYSAAMSAIITGSNGDMQDSCSFHDLGFQRAMACRYQTTLSPEVVEKVFYQVYKIARNDFGDCKGETPIIVNYQTFSRKNVMAQCPGVKPIKQDDNALTAEIDGVSK